MCVNWKLFIITAKHDNGRILNPEEKLQYIEWTEY